MQGIPRVSSIYNITKIFYNEVFLVNERKPVKSLSNILLSCRFINLAIIDLNSIYKNIIYFDSLSRRFLRIKLKRYP
jgi:hypothetical protein